LLKNCSGGSPGPPFGGLGGVPPGGVFLGVPGHSGVLAGSGSNRGPGSKSGSVAVMSGPGAPGGDLSAPDRGLVFLSGRMAVPFLGTALAGA